jgi:hypothetical protein
MTRPIALAVTATLGLAAPLAASERTIVEERLAEQNLCAGLQTEQFGQRIGLTEVEDVELREADLSLRGDDIEVSFTGRLACRSGADSVLSGNASARVAAAARLSLSDCAIDRIEVTLSDFDGTFGPVLGAFSAQIEEALAGEAEPLLVAACHGLRGRP